MFLAAMVAPSTRAINVAAVQQSGAASVDESASVHSGQEVLAQSSEAEWELLPGDGRCLDASGRRYRMYVIIYQTVASCKSLAEARASLIRGISFVHLGYAAGEGDGDCHIQVDKGVVLSGVGSNIHNADSDAEGPIVSTEYQASFACYRYTAAASATGDPHLSNILGERFDLRQPGFHTLVNVPRGTSPEESLLHVVARADKLGSACSDMYFEEVNVTGKWAEASAPGGFRFDAGAGRDDNLARWMRIGPVSMKVVRGHLHDGTAYLNMYLRQLGATGYAVGGLLGVDSHDEEEAPLGTCRHAVQLKLRRSVDQGGELGSVAQVGQ